LANRCLLGAGKSPAERLAQGCASAPPTALPCGIIGTFPADIGEGPRYDLRQNEKERQQWAS
jgi:hypothetical protein